MAMVSPGLSKITPPAPFPKGTFAHSHPALPNRTTFTPSKVPISLLQHQVQLVQPRHGLPLH